MNPVYLGTKERRLFALYEPAAVKAKRARAAVLCYPWGTEYIYAHRSMRQLAVKLSVAGFHTLRFDYFGTGDSGGETFQASPLGAETDIEVAIDGMKDMVGANRVALIGLRQGATLAARVAARHAADLDSLVLWDPVYDGSLWTRSKAAQYPQRSLLLVTELQGAAKPLPGIAMESFDAPQPWLESATTNGTVPARIIQRVTEWLA
jgi:uncharacterized protein